MPGPGSLIPHRRNVFFYINEPGFLLLREETLKRKKIVVDQMLDKQMFQGVLVRCQKKRESSSSPEKALAFVQDIDSPAIT